jgi:hypothetical protein|tara:strand:- start:36 stop:464 length:429 start_codon:yes stop_codon:yes gene_type:complete
MAVIEGTAYYAHVTTPNTKYDPVYSINLEVDEVTAADFKSRGFTVKQLPEGQQTLVIKRKVSAPNGGERDAPRLVDKFKNPLDCKVGNGSHVRVQYKEWETSNKYGDFKGLDFQALQVINLVEGAVADGAEFESEPNIEDEL